MPQLTGSDQRKSRRHNRIRVNSEIRFYTGVYDNAERIQAGPERLRVRSPMTARLRTTLEMIKWEHSIFALPFALTGAMLAAHGLPPWRILFWIVVCMVSARSAAMAFNRWADADIDLANPRTKSRAIPAGLLSRQFTVGFTIV